MATIFDDFKHNNARENHRYVVQTDYTDTVFSCGKPAIWDRKEGRFLTSMEAWSVNSRETWTQVIEQGE